MRAADVLIVDDNADLREFFVALLTLEGYLVAAAANGADALTYLRRFGPVAVVLLDLSMPVMDGWTFCREQQSDHRLADIPVVRRPQLCQSRLARPPASHRRRVGEAHRFSGGVICDSRVLPCAEITCSAIVVSTVRLNSFRRPAKAAVPSTCQKPRAHEGIQDGLASCDL